VDKYKQMKKCAFLPVYNTSGENSGQLLFLKDNRVDRYIYQSNHTKEKLLTGSVTSLGVVNKNYYSKLNLIQNFYDDYTLTHPFVSFKSPIFITTKQEQYFNGSLNESISYDYWNAVIHKQGLGFRGFREIKTSDLTRSRSQKQIFDPKRYSVLEEEENDFAKVNYTYTITTATNKTTKIQLTEKKVQDYLKNTIVTSYYTYNNNNYCFPVAEIVNYGGVVVEEITNTYYHNSAESGYLLGYLTNRVKTTMRSNETWNERMHVSAHNNKGKPTEIKIYTSSGTANLVSTENFVYDKRGNKTTHYIKHYSGKSFPTTYTYDNYGRLESKTDPMGFKVSFVYNSNGNLQQTINHKKQIITYFYDLFGRITSIDYPNRTVDETFFTFVGTTTNVKYRIQQTSTGKPITNSYFDALGREIASEVQNFNNSYSKTEKKYDSFGRLKTVSLPFFHTGAATLFNTYSYDNSDRVTSIVEDGSLRTTTFEYTASTNSVKVTKNGIASTSFYDAQGNLIKVRDPAGDIDYTLRPDGQPKTITAIGVETKFTYDNYGRRVTIEDKSAGLQTWTYDDFGNISSEQDANNKTINYGYDIFNRLTSIRRPYGEFNTTYVYNSDGLLQSETSSNNSSTTYQYDDLGRLWKEKETVNNKWLEKTYTYSGNNVTSLNYIYSSILKRLMFFTFCKSFGIVFDIKIFKNLLT